MLSPSTGSTHILNELSECVGVGGGGGVFASFLPGIAIALTKLVTTDTAKVGQVILIFSCSENKYDDCISVNTNSVSLSLWFLPAP